MSKAGESGSSEMFFVQTASNTEKAMQMTGGSTAGSGSMRPSRCVFLWGWATASRRERLCLSLRESLISTPFGSYELPAKRPAY